jgi:hypothetical protein
MTYKVTFRNQISALSFLLFVAPMLAAIVLVSGVDVGFVYSILLPYFIIFMLPGLYLHVRYLQINSGSSLLVEGSRLVSKNGTGQIITLNADDIDRIELRQAATAHTSKFSLTEAYHYARIIPKNGQPIIFTCLMAQNVEKALSDIQGVEVVKKHTFFCYV